ncbi:unnamed protein product [Mytilus coruscus]|uniref:Mutator-like transposase domain-containing protein n=1 Tax=Mytilus coruscus TaxID=42192 RepID=A0A6J8BHX2_MYTCO|nr:unnamed protein product [Mytilus coruscus]
MNLLKAKIVPVTRVCVDLLFSSDLTSVVLYFLWRAGRLTKHCRRNPTRCSIRTCLRCNACGEDSSVSTSRYRQEEVAVRKSKKYDINTRVVLGMLDCGLGYTQVNTLLSIMDLPTIDKKNLGFEEEVGDTLKKYAQETCNDACKVEKAIEDQKDQKDFQNIAVSYDMGWQKRGRAHNSLTGTT